MNMASRMFPLLLWASLFVWVEGMPACGPQEEVCEFTLVAAPKLTMMWGKILTYAENGKLYNYTVNDVSTAVNVPVDEVITADGWENSRFVLLFNESFPGPAIEVWENQMVKVHVVNTMHNDGLTVHWHGLHQAGTPFMDGVAFVSQCPILPGQTFTYHFNAYPKGTFWYHSHLGSQRSMGLYGPIVIHERGLPVPRMEELTWTLTDWNHDHDSEAGYYKMVYGLYEGRSKVKGTQSLDGGFFSMFRYHSGLLNGRGRYYDPATGEHNGAPLSTFVVTSGQSYRIRVIAAGELYPFRISVDQHPLTIIASDGYYLEPVTAQSFIINPGERFDFILNASQSVENYWIRGETLEVGENHTLEAILHYTGATTDTDPTSMPVECTPSEMCVVVNCPFTFYPKSEDTKCISFGELKAKMAQDTPNATEGEFKEQFLNFAFPGNKWTPGSINGRAYEQPVVSAVSQPHEIDTHCNDEQCGDGKVCKCTFSLPLAHAKTYQFVFLNMGIGKGWSHPIHMHGHSFYVVKMGYGRYNETDGKLMGDNLDIDCRGNPDKSKTYCNNATWTDQSWLNGHVPGLELEKPPRKDTLIVPTGGYAVVRIRADNPGVWIMHCHIQIHNMDGMAMLLNESYSNHPEVPRQFPSCRSFLSQTSDMETTETPTTNKPTPTTNKPTSKATMSTSMKTAGQNIIEPACKQCEYTEKTFWGVVGSLIAFICVLLIILFAYMWSHKPSDYRGSKYATEVPNERFAYDNKASL